MDYENQYIKYKNKYICLKNKQNGGHNKIIIHICGASGSGKTTLGNKLQNKFGNKIIVKDIDILRNEFIKKYYGNKKWKIIDKNAYQQYIDNYVSKQNKPLIFVGLNNMPWWHKNHYYNLYSIKNYYIDIDDMTIIKQKCLRLFNDIPNDKNAINDLMNNNDLFVKLVKNAIGRECHAKGIIKMNKKWSKDYKKQNYNFKPMDTIFKEVSDVLDKYIK